MKINDALEYDTCFVCRKSATHEIVSDNGLWATFLCRDHYEQLSRAINEHGQNANATEQTTTPEQQEEKS